MKRTVSLIIPAYNEEGQLAECLDSIAAQTVIPDEVILVDNNSTDATAEIAGGYPFVRIVNEKQQGRVFARNAGFDAARGDILARIDADTVLPPGWVERIADFYSDTRNVQNAFTGGAAFYNVRFAGAVSWLYNLMSFDFNRLLIGHPTLWGSNMALTREQWQTVRAAVCLHNGIHEDLDLSMHLHAANYRIAYDRKFTVGALMRRVESNRHELWDYLQWWPRTLRVHGHRSWVVCWLFGCLFLYGLTPLLTGGAEAARFTSKLFSFTSSPEQG